MTLTVTLLSVASLCAGLYLLRYCYAPASWTKTVVKTLAVVPLALIAYLGDSPVLLGLALTACALGDFLLSRDTVVSFAIGVLAFAAGHLAFSALFVGHDLAALSRLGLPQVWPIILGLLLFGLLMMRLLFRHAGALRFAVIGYVPVILVMAVAALTLPADWAVAGPVSLVWLAALLFLMSDTTLALQEFVLPPDHALRRIIPFWIWSTYWLAQLGFLVTLSGVEFGL